MTSRNRERYRATSPSRALTVGPDSLYQRAVTASSRYHRQSYGRMPDGREIGLHTLTNKQNATVRLIDYGAIVTSLVVPDGNGQLSDVVLGFDDLNGYLHDTCFLGAVVGRYANRIADGDLVIDGAHYQLPQNQATNHLHGGPDGFYRACFSAAAFEDHESSGVVFSHVSPDGHAGYPGELSVEVRYRWDDQMRLTVEYSARTNRATVVNLTQHSYFNLAGKGSILDHDLTITAERFTPTDVRAIPTGELRLVQGTPFDFRTKKRIGRDIEARDEQLQMAGGFDHNWVVLGNAGEMRPAAVLECSSTRRRLSVETTEPGIQFYSGNFLPKDGSIHRAGVSYGWREGLCLETQHFPDSPHHPEFPSALLRPGERYHSATRFSFAVT